MFRERLHSQRIRDLIDAATSVAGQTDLSSLLRSTINTAIELTGARYGAVGIIGEHGTLVDFIPVGMDEDDIKRISHYPRGTVCSERSPATA